VREVAVVGQGELGHLGAHLDAAPDIAVEPAVKRAGHEGVTGTGPVDDRDGLDLEDALRARRGQVGARAPVGGHDRGGADLLAQVAAHVHTPARDTEDDTGVGSRAEQDRGSPGDRLQDGPGLLAVPQQGAEVDVERDVDAPLVEGVVLAAVEASSGTALEDLAGKMQQARDMHKIGI